MLVCSDRLLIRSSDYYLHMVVSGSALCGGHCANHLELVDIIGKEMKPVSYTHLTLPTIYSV